MIIFMVGGLGQFSPSMSALKQALKSTSRRYEHKPLCLLLSSNDNVLEPDFSACFKADIDSLCSYEHKPFMSALSNNDFWQNTILSIQNDI